MPYSDGRIRPLSRNAQMSKYFGKPCDTSQMAVYNLPIIGRAYLHKRVAKASINVFDSIQQAGLSSLVDRDSYGGTYCCRAVRGSDAQSPHSWGVAIDLNTDHIMVGDKETQGRSNFRCSAAQVPDSLKRLEPFFTAWGFSWGGFWRSYLDPMHFEATEYTCRLLEGTGGTAVGNDSAACVIKAAQIKVARYSKQPVPHDPPLLVRDATVICEGKFIDGALWTPTRKTLAAAGKSVAWHGEQGKGYIIDGK